MKSHVPIAWVLDAIFYKRSSKRSKELPLGFEKRPRCSVHTCQHIHLPRPDATIYVLPIYHLPACTSVSTSPPTPCADLSPPPSRVLPQQGVEGGLLKIRGVGEAVTALPPHHSGGVG